MVPKNTCWATPLSLSLASVAHAATLTLSLSIPRQEVAEYHRPYVAILLHQPDGGVQPLAVWYDRKNREEGGIKWLRDLRNWAHDKATERPVDAIAGATRRPGNYTLSYSIGELPPGRYEVRVEAVREVGGYELLRLPFNWTGTEASISAIGSKELGEASLSIRP